jgi:hypothetical protein
VAGAILDVAVKSWTPMLNPQGMRNLSSASNSKNPDGVTTPTGQFVGVYDAPFPNPNDSALIEDTVSTGSTFSFGQPAYNSEFSDLRPTNTALSATDVIALNWTLQGSVFLLNSPTGIVWSSGKVTSGDVVWSPPQPLRPTAASEQNMFPEIASRFPSPVPTQSLQLWLKSDRGTILNGSTVSQWNDQSGNSRHAVQATSTSQPTLVTHVLNGRPVVTFDGFDDFMTFALPVNGLTGMTIFLVSANSVGMDGAWNGVENAPIFWNEEPAGWGTVHLSPFQTLVKFRFGTGQIGNMPTYVRPSSIGATYSITVAKKDGTTDSLYVNGALVVNEGGKFSQIAATRDTGNIGRGYNDNTYFPGQIAELLVYTRALSDEERQGVERYLNGRYFSP